MGVPVHAEEAWCVSPQIRLGIIVHLQDEPEPALRQVQAMGFPTCQIQCRKVDLFNDILAERLRFAAHVCGVEITTVWAGLPGRNTWNLSTARRPSAWRRRKLVPCA